MRGILVFAPKFNTKGRKDATGAFQPEARAFQKAWSFNSNVALHLIDNSQPPAKMANAVLENIASFTTVTSSNLNVAAFFCHGWSKGIQFGFGKSNVRRLAAALSAAAGHPEIVVALYACLAGNAPGGPPGGDGGFADLLRDALCATASIGCRCRVDAHTTTGHATRNPFVRRFEGMRSLARGVGGYYIVSPGSKLWLTWRKMLRSDDLVEAQPAPMRLAFPLLSTCEIHEAIDAEYLK